MFNGNDEARAKASYTSLVDATYESLQVRETVFRIHYKDVRNKTVEIVPNTEILTLKYWSQDMVNTIVKIRIHTLKKG